MVTASAAPLSTFFAACSDILGWLVAYVVVSAPENHLFESKGEKEIAVVFQGHKLREKSLVESAAKKRRS